MNDVKIEASWKELLHHEFQKEYFKNLADFLKQEKLSGKLIYPSGPLIFNAFACCPFPKLKVVIIGQDPYHGPGEAMGLAFSVPKGIAIPPSLLNIYKELQRAYGYPIPKHGDLTSWAEQGVLLLNASLTVVHKSPNAHKSIGWATFTDEIIRQISQKKTHVVFMLWGNFAKSKRSLIDPERHLILESPHPSPLAGNAFLGNNHFTLANEYLFNHAKEKIDWQII